MPFTDRMYCEINPTTGVIDCFCRTREGVLGPFDSEQMAIAALQGHLKYSDGRYAPGLRGSLGDKSAFDVDRVHCRSDEITGTMKWYCDSREGLLGPFDTQKIACSSLQAHIKRCEEHHQKRTWLREE